MVQVGENPVVEFFVEAGNSLGEAQSALPNHNNSCDTNTGLESGVTEGNRSVVDLALSLLSRNETWLNVKCDREQQEENSDSDNDIPFSIPVKVEILENDQQEDGEEMSQPPSRHPRSLVISGGITSKMPQNRLLYNYNNRVKNENSQSSSSTATTPRTPTKSSSPSKLPIRIADFSSLMEYNISNYKIPRKSSSSDSSGNQSKATERGDQGKVNPDKSSKDKPKQSSVLKPPQLLQNNANPQPCSSRSVENPPNNVQRPQSAKSPDIIDVPSPSMPFLMPSLQDLLVDVQQGPIPSPSTADKNAIMREKAKEKIKQSMNKNTPRKIQLLDSLPPMPIPNLDSKVPKPPMPNTDSKRVKPQKVTTRRRSYGVSDEQLSALREVFVVQQNPQLLDILGLESATGLKRKQIMRWFKNERNKAATTASQGPSQSETVSQDNTQDTSRTNDYNASSQANYATNQQGQGETSNYANSGPSTDQNGENLSSQYQDHSLPPKKRKAQAPPGNLSTPTKISKLHQLEKREMRMRMAGSVNLQSFRECLNQNQRRIECLFLLYTKRKYDMKKTLLKETVRLRETTTKVSPFSNEQVKEMDQWRNHFFESVSENASEDKKEKLQCVQTSIINVWHPIIIYGRLTGVSLEVAIEDFLVRASRGIADTSDIYTVPQFLRHIEQHP